MTAVPPHPVASQPAAAVRVRPAATEDAAPLAELAERIFVDTYLADNRPDDVAAFVAQAFGPQIQAREIADPAVRYLLAEVDGQLAGYVLLRPDEPPPCVPADAAVSIARFYVAHEWHGRGVAGALMDAALGEAAAMGARIVWLMVWMRNVRALAFYAKRGFHIVGEAEFTMGSDVQTDHVMLRELP